MNENKNRYSRQLILPEIGPEGQAKLSKASVLIIGVGGLGCPVAEYLSAIGVGRIGLMDADTVQSSNLHRQLLYGPADCGRKKVEVAAERLNLQNPDLQIDVCRFHFNEAIDDQLLLEYDLIIDATDNLDAKYAINDACVAVGKPWVGASLHKFEGQVSVFNLNGSASYRCLFPQRNIAVPGCEEAGVLGIVPGLLGLMQAMEAAKILLGIGNTLAGKLKTIDFLNGNEMSFSFSRDNTQIQVALDNWINRKNEIRTRLPEFSGYYLDVRDHGEQPLFFHEKLMKIPLPEIENRYQEIPRDQPVLIFCKTGIRSRKAVDLLTSQYDYRNLRSSEAGYRSLFQKEEI